jgi:23S rRNA pseudouridine955/2504/2580 synthase
MIQNLPHKNTIAVPQSDDGQRLDRWLQSHFSSVPYALIQKALRTGDIRVDGQKADGKARLTAGQEIRLPPALRHALAGTNEGGVWLSTIEKQNAKSMVLYEDAHILVLNKPSGLATQGGVKTRMHLDHLLNAFAKNPDDKPKLVHRLDKETSGVVLVAKNRAVAERLGNAFKERAITKTYVALTLDVPRTHEDTIRLPLLRTPEGVVVDRQEGKLAVTHYRLLSYAEREVGFVALRPETGRMHQLRVHLAHLRCPILGDEKYGGTVGVTSRHQRLAEAAAERMWLHALALHFNHPVTNKEMHVFAPIPQSMRQWLEEWQMEVPTLTDTNKPLDPMNERL